jgi:hypothetical protein
MSTFIDPKAGIEYNFEGQKVDDIIRETDPKKNPEVVILR